MNETIKGLLERRSVRVFDERAISPEDKALILECAFQAPTAGNQQLYTILDITDEALKERLSVLCDNQPFIKTAPLVLIFFADTKKYMDAYRLAGFEPREAGQGDVTLAAADAVIAAQNSVTAAWSLGIGSCYIGDILENAEALREELSLPHGLFPAAMVVFGYEAKTPATPQKPKRFEGKYIVRENRYSPLSEEELRKMFYERTKQRGFEEWIKAFMDRKYESEFSREMNRSAQVYLDEYRNKGF